MHDCWDFLTSFLPGRINIGLGLNETFILTAILMPTKNRFFIQTPTLSLARDSQSHSTTVSSIIWPGLHPGQSVLVPLDHWSILHLALPSTKLICFSSTRSPLYLSSGLDLTKLICPSHQQSPILHPPWPSPRLACLNPDRPINVTKISFTQSKHQPKRKT